jgi:UDP-N-acetylglucosamine:LPS N-acetylglucosamine transferase
MKPEEINNQRILFSALNWGMGHVSRSISIIHQLKNQGNNLFIACSGSQRKVFEAYFTDIEFIEHDDYPFEFKGNGNFAIDLLLAFPKLNRRLKKEKKEIKHLIKKHDIDICISDHRYGFYKKKCTSIFITHQLNLPLPFLFKGVNSLHRQLLKKFNYIWVLDNEHSKHAGKLSTNKNFKNLYYIGIHSRFSLYPSTIKENYTAVIISGPSPYREQFFLEQLSAAKQRIDKTIIITPQQNLKASHISNNITVQLSIDWRACDQIILKANKVISRAGYSTVMDLNYLQCEKELHPTKGQWEQEYLAKL